MTPQRYDVRVRPEDVEELLSPDGLFYEYSEGLRIDIRVDYRNAQDFLDMAKILREAAADADDEYRAMVGTPDYDRTASDEWNDLLPDGVIALAENDEMVKIELGESPPQTVDATKEALREKGPWETAEAFIEDVDWDAYD